MPIDVEAEPIRWAYCRYGKHAIWRADNSIVWRDASDNSTCEDAPHSKHLPER